MERSLLGTDFEVTLCTLDRIGLLPSKVDLLIGHDGSAPFAVHSFPTVCLASMVCSLMLGAGKPVILLPQDNGEIINKNK